MPVPTHRAAAASTAVPAEPIANGCHWEQSWLALWQTTEEDLEAALPNLAQRIDKLSKKGKCKGLVLWSQLTAHRLWRGELSVGGGTESALSLHNQARQAWAKLVMKALKPWKPSVKVFFLTPEVINMAVMMLKPAKDDVNVAFPPKPNRHIKLWGLADSYWAFHGITKLPAYYLSQELDGMQCDGLHFGSSYDRMHDGCGVCAHATCTCAYPHPLPCIPSPLSWVNPRLSPLVCGGCHLTYARDERCVVCLDTWGFPLIALAGVFGDA